MTRIATWFKSDKPWTVAYLLVQAFLTLVAYKALVRFELEIYGTNILLIPVAFLLVSLIVRIPHDVMNIFFHGPIQYIVRTVFWMIILFPISLAILFLFDAPVWLKLICLFSVRSFALNFASILECLSFLDSNETLFAVWEFKEIFRRHRLPMPSVVESQVIALATISDPLPRFLMLSAFRELVKLKLHELRLANALVEALLLEELAAFNQEFRARTGSNIIDQ